MSATTTSTATPTHAAGFPPAPSEAHQRAEGVKALDYRVLLNEALTKPGMLSAAYSAFHRFSVGNQMLAAMQLSLRGLPLSPIASFNAWRERGRFVKRGEKALSLYMPVKAKAAPAEEGDAGETAEAGAFRQVLMLRPNWFSLDQTDGEPFTPEIRTPAWDAAKALAALDVTEVPFEDLRGNCLGYAVERTIAISPLNPLKHKTRFHELAHVVLGHTTGGALFDAEELPQSIREAEAEGTAYLLCVLLDLPGQVEARGYIQSWLAGESLPEKSARRIFRAADDILKAGAPESSQEGA